MRQKTYLKAQKCSKFHSRASLRDRMFELIINIKAKRWVPTSFAITLLAVALPIVLTVEFNFELILYIITILFS